MADTRAYTSIGGVLTAITLAGLALSGCSTEQTITKESLEAGLTETLRGQGRVPEAVECPGPVNAEMAERTACVMTERGERFHIEVVVTSLYDGKAEYDIAVDPKPME